MPVGGLVLEMMKAWSLLTPDKTVFCLGIGLLSVTAAVCKSLVQLTGFRLLLLSRWGCCFCFFWGGGAFWREGGRRERERVHLLFTASWVQNVCVAILGSFGEREKVHLLFIASWVQNVCVAILGSFGERERWKERECTCCSLNLECRMCVLLF